MIRWGTLLLELCSAVCIFVIIKKFLWDRFNKAGRIAVFVLSLCAVFIAFSAASSIETPHRRLTITAHGKNLDSQEAAIYLKAIVLDGAAQEIPEPVSGQWTWYAGRYCWFEDGDERLKEGTTESVTFEIGTAHKTELIFLGNRWKGIVKILIDGAESTLDTYVDSEDGVEVRAVLPAAAFRSEVRTVLLPVFSFAVVLLLLCTLSTIVVKTGQKAGGKLFPRLTGYGPFHKLLRYQFLFEELVKRDFKKKYKRTVLGMAWSVLSPLLTLLVMRVVFTQFFGRNMAHYTTYLFCGNLVFSYFNESTSQGMQSLMSNASIFSKVNVPKYLFLFSKNIQTLLNFGLTLCVFLLFCILDRIDFTWRFIFLLYPIALLVLFNIGTGLILSALFVFFRDVQYLWSVFTQLLMYMSAIFYTIDKYTPKAQNLFLLNPIYLFIRYFRKIVIDATIPTVWFHLLMLADVVIVLAAGGWMYKKFNTRFLYYV